MSGTSDASLLTVEQNDRLLLARFQPMPVSTDTFIISRFFTRVNKPQVDFSADPVLRQRLGAFFCRS